MSSTWAIVTAVSPLRIMLDGDTTALPFAPPSLAGTVAVGDMVRCELDGIRIIVHGRNGGPTLPLAYENLVINGDFRVNQRGAVSGTSLASGAYFLDRWKSGDAANAVTWTGDDTVGRVLTVPAGHGIYQPIERTNMPAGTYTFNHDGTAPLHVYNSGTTPPAASSGPVTVTVDGSADVILLFEAGTVSNVRGYRGTSDYPFVPRKIGDERLLCYRYFWMSKPTEIIVYGFGFQRATTSAWASFPLFSKMRVAPVISFADLYFTDGSTYNATITGFTSFTDLNWPALSLQVLWSAAVGSVGTPGIVTNINTTTSYLSLDAEL